MSHRRPSTFCIAVALAVVATGCGSSPDDAAPSTTTAPTTVPVVDSTSDVDPAAELATAEEALAAAEEALAAAEDDLAAAEDDLAAAEDDLAAAEQGNADLEEDLIEAQQHAADTDQTLTAAEAVLASAEAVLAAAKDDLAAAEQGNVDLEEDLIEAQQHAADTDQTLASAEAALEVIAAELAAAEEAALSTSHDLERATSDQDDADLANQLLQEERRELRDALNEAVELANSLDDTVYPDCNPVHAVDRSLFGIPTGTDMAEVISQVTERCGPADPFIPMFDRWDYSPDRDQWGAMCGAYDVWTSRTWQTGDRYLTVSFYRGMDDDSDYTDTGWMFGWTGGDLPEGIEIGMTKDEVTDILDLDPDLFMHEDLSDYGIDRPDHTYYWGEGAGWGLTASTHGQPYNSSLLYFDEGLFSGFRSTDFNLCQ